MNCQQQQDAPKSRGDDDKRTKEGTIQEQKKQRKKYRKRKVEPVHQFIVEPEIVQLVFKPKKVTNHSYSDFSRVPPDAGYCFPTDPTRMSFSEKLHAMLSDHRFSNIITWLPHGRSFRLLMPNQLEEQALPQYFGHRRYSKLLSQLKANSFKTITTGVDRGCWYHECFLEDLPHLCKYMPIYEVSTRRLLPDPEHEPDFYAISRNYPLPKHRHLAQSQLSFPSEPTLPTQLQLSSANTMQGVVNPFFLQSSIMPQGFVSRQQGTDPTTQGNSRSMQEELNRQYYLQLLTQSSLHPSTVTQVSTEEKQESPEMSPRPLLGEQNIAASQRYSRLLSNPVPYSATTPNVPVVSSYRSSSASSQSQIPAGPTNADATQERATPPTAIDILDGALNTVSQEVDYLDPLGLPFPASSLTTPQNRDNPGPLFGENYLFQGTDFHDT